MCLCVPVCRPWAPLLRRSVWRRSRGCCLLCHGQIATLEVEAGTVLFAIRVAAGVALLFGPNQQVNLVGLTACVWLTLFVMLSSGGTPVAFSIALALFAALVVRAALSFAHSISATVQHYLVLKFQGCVLL